MLLRENRFYFFLIFSMLNVYAAQAKAEDWRIAFEKTVQLQYAVSLTKDLAEKQQVPDSLRLFKNDECSIYLLFTPEIIITFDTTEYAQLLRKKSEKFEDYLYFLTDNDITESLFKLIYDSSASVIRIDRISTDININFGEVLYSYFPDSLGRIESVIDWYCHRENSKIVWYKITYTGFTPAKIFCEVYERE